MPQRAARALPLHAVASRLIFAAADALGFAVEFVQADVSVGSDARRMVDATLERFGRLDLA